MSTPTTWQCPGCGEVHDAQFDVCWNCGTNQAGERDRDFQITELVVEEDQLRPSATEEDPFDGLKLPDFSYYSLPPIIGAWIALIVQNPNRDPFAVPSAAEIVLQFVTACLIGLPWMMVMTRAMFIEIIRRLKPPRGAFDLRRVFVGFTIFALPVGIRKSHRWFVPIYYASIVAYFGAAIWYAVSQMKFDIAGSNAATAAFFAFRCTAVR